MFTSIHFFAKSKVFSRTSTSTLLFTNRYISHYSRFFVTPYMSDIDKLSSFHDASWLNNTSSMLVCKRFEQYQHTSEIYGNLHKMSNRKASHEKAAKWIMKSTKEYVDEGNTKLEKVKTSTSNMQKGELEHLYSFSERRKEIKEVVAKAKESIDMEVDRLSTDKSSRFKKMYLFFKRQGKMFIIVYCIAYFVPLILLYFSLASGILKKEWLFDFFFLIFDKYINRESLYSQIEKFDTYINLGCAFVLNDILEIIRLPLVISGFFVFKRYFKVSGIKISKLRNARQTIFRSSAPES